MSFCNTRQQLHQLLGGKHPANTFIIICFCIKMSVKGIFWISLLLSAQPHHREGGNFGKYCNIDCAHEVNQWAAGRRTHSFIFGIKVILSLVKETATLLESCVTSRFICKITSKMMNWRLVFWKSSRDSVVLTYWSYPLNINKASVFLLTRWFQWASLWFF